MCVTYPFIELNIENHASTFAPRLRNARSILEQEVLGSFDIVPGICKAVRPEYFIVRLLDIELALLTLEEQ